MLWVLKRTISMRGFFEHTEHMFKLMDKKITAILQSIILRNWTYEEIGKDKHSLRVNRDSYMYDHVLLKLLTS